MPLLLGLIYSKKNVEALEGAQQLRDKRRSEEDKERQREIAKARAAKLKQRGSTTRRRRRF